LSFDRAVEKAVTSAAKTTGWKKELKKKMASNKKRRGTDDWWDDVPGFHEENRPFEETHVKVSVVSPLFIGLSYSERVDLVVRYMEQRLHYEAQCVRQEEVLLLAQSPDQVFCPLTLLPQDAGLKLKHLSVVGDRVRSLRIWAGGGLLGLASAGYPVDGSGLGVCSIETMNHADSDISSSSTKMMKLVPPSSALSLPQFLFDLQTPSQWRPQDYPPDAFERFDAGFKRNRLLHVTNNDVDHAMDAIGGGGGGGGGRSKTPQKKGRDNKKSKKNEGNIGINNDFSSQSDAQGASSGSYPAALAGSVDYVKYVMNASDHAKLKEENARHEEEKRHLLGTPLLGKEDGTKDALKLLRADDVDDTDSESNDSDDEDDGISNVKRKPLFIKYGATLFNETTKMTYLHQEIKKREEEVCVCLCFREPYCVRAVYLHSYIFIKIYIYC
jgi:stress-induced morphogen